MRLNERIWVICLNFVTLFFMLGSLSLREQEVSQTRQNLIQNASISVRSLYCFIKAFTNPPIQIQYFEPYGTGEGRVEFVHVSIPDIKLAFNVNEPFSKELLRVLDMKGIRAVSIKLSRYNTEQAQNLVCCTILEQFRLILAKRVATVRFCNPKNVVADKLSESGRKNKTHEKADQKIPVERCVFCKYVKARKNNGVECLCLVRGEWVSALGVCPHYECKAGKESVANRV